MESNPIAATPAVPAPSDPVLSDPVLSDPVLSDPAPGPTSWLTVPEAAERLEVRVTKVHQLVGSGDLLAVRRDGAWRLPAELVPDLRSEAGRTSNLARHLAGVLSVLRDAGYSPEEALGWLYTPDGSLPEGTPAAALAHRPTEVKRRAQALGF